MTSLSNKSALSCSGKAILGATGFLLAQLVFADATVVYGQSSGTQKSINSMEIKDGKIRFTPPNQNSNFSLYDSKTGALTHVDLNQKQYLVMGEKDIAEQANRAKQQMDVMRQRMMEKMKIKLTETEMIYLRGSKEIKVPYTVKSSDKTSITISAKQGSIDAAVVFTLIDGEYMSFKSSGSDDMAYYVWKKGAEKKE